MKLDKNDAVWVWFALTSAIKRHKVEMKTEGNEAIHAIRKQSVLHFEFLKARIAHKFPEIPKDYP